MEAFGKPCLFYTCCTPIHGSKTSQLTSITKQ